MKKYNVRVYLHTFIDYEVEANNEKEAKEIAEDMEYDMEQMLDNMVPADDADITELPVSLYDKKLWLENYGYEWNVLDQMSEDDINQLYDEIMMLGY